MKKLAIALVLAFVAGDLCAQYRNVVPTINDAPVTSTNRLPVTCDNCGNGTGGVGAADGSSFTAGASVFAAIGGVYNDALTAVTSTKWATARITAYRAEHVNLRDNSGNEVGIAAAPLYVQFGSAQHFVCDSGCGTASSVLMADTTGNPTIPQTASFGMLYNGGSWDRWRGDATSGAWVNVKNASIAITASSLPLPAGAATESTLLGIKTGTDKIPSSPATDRTTAASPFSVRLSDGAAFFDPRSIRALTSSDVVTVANTAFIANAGTNLNTSALALEAGGHLASIDAKDFATQTTLALIKAKTDNLDALLSSRTKPADQQHAIIDSGTTVVTQSSGSNLHVNVDSAPTTAVTNAGLSNIPADPAREGGNLATLAGKDFATSAKQDTGNTSLGSIKTNTDPLVASAAGGYIRQDSTATIAKESGGNLAQIVANQTNGTEKTQLVGSTTANVTVVVSSQLDTMLLAASATRKAWNVCNSSQDLLLLKLGSGASPWSYTVKLPPSGCYGQTDIAYNGQINAVFYPGGNGQAVITELQP